MNVPECSCLFCHAKNMIVALLKYLTDYLYLII